MRHIKNFMRLCGVVTLTLFAFAFSAHAQDVNCDLGDNLQTQINSGDNFVTFTGTCNQGITIARDGVTLDGGGTGVIVPGTSASGQPGFLVVGATRVRVQNLTITDGGFVSIINGSFVDFTNVAVNSPFSGMVVSRGANLRMAGSTITRGTVPSGVGCSALCVFSSSSLDMTTTTISADTPSLPVFSVGRGSSATLRGGNVVTNAGDGAVVSLFGQSSLRSDDPSQSSTAPQNGDGIDRFNGSLAVQLTESSFASLRSTKVTGNSKVQDNSTLVLGGPFGANPEEIDIVGNIRIRRGSQLNIKSPLVSVDGNIICKDLKSSLNRKNFAGIHTIECTNFDGEIIE